MFIKYFASRESRYHRTRSLRVLRTNAKPTRMPSCAFLYLLFFLHSILLPFIAIFTIMETRTCWIFATTAGCWTCSKSSLRARTKLPYSYRTIPRMFSFEIALRNLYVPAESNEEKKPVVYFRQIFLRCQNTRIIICNYVSDSLRFRCTSTTFDRWHKCRLWFS